MRYPGHLDSIYSLAWKSKLPRGPMKLSVVRSCMESKSLRSKTHSDDTQEDEEDQLVRVPILKIRAISISSQ